MYSQSIRCVAVNLLSLLVGTPCLYIFALGFGRFGEKHPEFMVAGMNAFMAALIPVAACYFSFHAIRFKRAFQQGWQKGRHRG